MNRIFDGAGIKRPVRVMEMTGEMRRTHRDTHFWKTILIGTDVT